MRIGGGVARALVAARRGALVGRRERARTGAPADVETSPTADGVHRRRRGGLVAARHGAPAAAHLVAGPLCGQVARGVRGERGHLPTEFPAP